MWLVARGLLIAYSVGGISEMANIGKKIREIEVVPKVEPDPTYVPDEPAAPVIQPEKEPARACSKVLS